MRIFNILAVAVATSMTAAAANAASVTITGVMGEWAAAGPSTAYGLSTSTDSDKTQVLWGKAPSGGAQSGYEFAGVIPPAVSTTPDTQFNLGLFTHFNNPIYTNPGRGYTTAIEQAELRIKYDVMIGSQTFQISNVFDFTHDETPNEGNRSGTCAHGGQSGAAGINSNGCADRVTANRNEGSSETIIVDGLEYTFNFSGFLVNGEVLDFFLTKESAINEAYLVGSYSVSEVLSQVPLPAAGWMLIAGVGGLAALKRRKARSNA